jgi:hypothetical protein
MSIVYKSDSVAQQIGSSVEADRNQLFLAVARGPANRTLQLIFCA